ncbi:DUF4192 domain-containing protein [Arthrobacter koreensis]|uniref:DUF4192 domain-containing protein n=1 Tax=Arthrobacter koreensis TaxID=199136 RepID=UPI002DBD4058|nr:DUF4192 domain-containing protein [Arthrobacter koreensis]MEB7504187.1 DUF4192 domain-containing protein [Arthrobacter koreensis]
MSEPQKAGHPAGGRPPAEEPSPAGGEEDGSAGTLRVGTPQDILAFVPHCLGFQPRESLVLLGLRGSRLGATLRLDLPRPFGSSEPPDPEALELLSGYCSRIASLLSNDDAADSVLAVMYTGLPWLEGAPPPHSALMELLGDALERSGLSLRDAWLAGNGTWRDYFCSDAACCPWPGYPLDEVTGSSLNAELVYRGSAYAATLDESQRTPGRFRTAALDNSVEDIRSARAGKWSDPGAFAEALAAWEQRISSALVPKQPPDTVCCPAPGSAAIREDAFLLASLESKPVRDTVLVLAAAGMRAAAEGARRWLQPPTGARAMAGESAAASSAEAGRQFRAILIGRSSAAPDWVRLDRAYAAFTDLVQRASGEPAAALLTLLGWIEWARGRSSRAELCLSAALGEEPGYRLAALLRELLRRGELPQWALSPATAWRGERPA